MDKKTLEFKLKNKENYVKRLTDEIVENKLKVKDRVHLSIFLLCLVVLNSFPGFLIIKFLPNLYILSIPYFIVGSYFMPYAFTEILDTINLSQNVKEENNRLRSRAIILRKEIETVTKELQEIKQLETKEEVLYIEPIYNEYEKNKVRTLKK